MFVDATHRTGFCAVLGFALSLVVGATAATLNVPADYPTIQAAIDAAVNGDEVVVAPGTYQENINFNGKTITVRSSDGPTVTTITGGTTGAAVTCDHSEPRACLLDGFTVTGGGVYIDGSAPTILRCTFSENTTEGLLATTIVNGSPLIGECTYSANGCFGAGAIKGWGVGTPVIDSCTFTNNASGTSGGAICLNDPGFVATITGCTFIGNTAAGDGGAVYARAQNASALSGCTFQQNSASWGGAILTIDNSSLGVSDCVFQQNTCTNEGGAIFCNGGQSAFAGCTFEGNSAPDGGAVNVAYSSTATFRNCGFFSNTANFGGAVHLTTMANPTFEDCTFEDNEAVNVGGALAGGLVTLRRCAFTSNSAGTGGAVAIRYASSYGLIEDCTFSQNMASMASGAGGALDVRYDGASVSVTGCSFDGVL